MGRQEWRKLQVSVGATTLSILGGGVPNYRLRAPTATPRLGRTALGWSYGVSTRRADSSATTTGASRCAGIGRRMTRVSADVCSAHRWRTSSSLAAISIRGAKDFGG